MADSSYNAEVKNIEQFLSLQKPSSTPTHISTPIAVSEDSIEPSNYMAPRFLKKNKTKVSILTSLCLFSILPVSVSKC